MCYFSTTLKKGSYRDARAGEDMVIVADGYGHHYTASPDDGKVTCVAQGTEVHVAVFRLVPGVYDQFSSVNKKVARNLIGKPVSGTFFEHSRHGMASDWIMIEGAPFHLTWIVAGTQLYTGPKKVSLETRLGADDPSISLDHRTETDEVPALRRVLSRIGGLCSVTR